MTPGRLRRLTVFLWHAVAAAAAALVAFHPMRNADLWWHLAAGRRIWSSLSLPTVDPFSFPELTRPWHNHEWLAEVLLFGWTKIFGLESLWLWLLSLLIATSVLLFRLLYRSSQRAWVAALGTGVALLLLRPFVEFRPHLFSLLGLVLLLSWWKSTARNRIALAALFVLWSNLHRGAIFGVLALGVLLGGEWLASVVREPSARRRALAKALGLELLLHLAVALGAGLVNPAPWQWIRLPLRFAFATSTEYRSLKEWLPPFSPEGVSISALPWVLIGFAALTLAGSWRLRGRNARPPIHPLVGALLLGLLTCGMALRAGRFLPLFGIGLALLLSEVLRPNVAPRGAVEPGRSRALTAAAIPLVVVLSLLVALSRYPLGQGTFSILVSEESFPVDILDAVERAQWSGRVYSYFGWGGYVHWRTDGRFTVAIDSRADTVFDDSTFLDYRRVQYGGPGWLDVVERSGARFFLWPTTATPQLSSQGQVDALLATGRWRLLREDFVGALLIRADAETTGPPVPASEPTTIYGLLAKARVAMQAGEGGAAERILLTALAQEPRLLVACRNLANVQAHRGRLDDAWETRRRCNQIFPESEADLALERYIESRARRR